MRSARQDPYRTGSAVLKLRDMKITILGLSITSSWGNGHATTFRSLVKGLHNLGHSVVFFERDVPWYSANRDMPDPQFCRVVLYNSVSELALYSAEITGADLVIVGSYVPDGTDASRYVLENATGIKAFYDIDTPVTLAKLRSGSCRYLSPELIPLFDLYLSFSAGPVPDIFEKEFGSPAARQLYCSVDPVLYYPVQTDKIWDLGYLGTYSDDRQPVLDKLLSEAAVKYRQGRFVVAGPQYPPSIVWPGNVERIEHLPPDRHVEFYNSQKYTLNITRRDMVTMGYSPSVRLFEAAACSVPVISDRWEGLDTIFTPGDEILIAQTSEDTVRYLTYITEEQRLEIGFNARRKVLEKHTGEQRAKELENYFEGALARKKQTVVI
jgi:spore maturation protein CgeB